MKMVEINWKPEDRILRQFGWLCLVFFPLIGWLVRHRPWPMQWTSTDAKVIGSLAAAGLASAAIGQIRPSLLRPLYVGLSLIAMPIGLVVSEVLVAVMFFGIFTPVALIFRLIGRDPMDRKLQPAATTYWTVKPRTTDMKRYFRQS